MTHSRRRPLLAAIQLALFLMIGLLLIGPAGSVAAQDSPTGPIQLISDHINPGSTNTYRLSDLQEGDILYIFMTETSGNLDPFAGLIDSSEDLVELQARISAEVAQLQASDEAVALGINRARDELFLAWDDDSGQGYAAAFAYDVPADGDYLLLTSGALSSFGRGTFGDFDLLLGINASEVLTGTADPAGAPFAERERTSLDLTAAVDEVTGEITASRLLVTHNLRGLQPQDSVTIFAEQLSGDLTPIIILRDFGGKPLDAANLSGQASQAALEFTVDEGGRSFVIEVESGPRDDGQPTEGTYRLLVGVNAQEVMSGEAEPTETSVLQLPIEVQTGFKLQQIVEVDSQNETFTVVGDVRFDWQDPALAFSPDTCQCEVKIYTASNFSSFLKEVDNRWPDFSFFNQQGNRWTQNQAAAIWPDGRARYYERFTTNFQADFDFEHFPFDVQTFPVHTQMVFNDETYRLVELPGYSEISVEHGEDEFIISDFETEITTVPSNAGEADNSRFSFSFTAPRHLNYYIFQIFVPIGLIILISWFTFFLRDYNRRIEAAAANVLLFIAFSFSLSDNYPRLGYLTFLDAIMLVTFVVNALVVLYNVYMKHLETAGQGERAEEIDHYLDWVYPIAYLILIGVVVFIFFGRG